MVERVIEKAVDSTLSKLDFTPQFWKIYVDDHITAIPDDKIMFVKDLLNQYLPGVIEFTEEIEDNNQINFLDVTLHTDESGKIRSNWFSKPIASNRLINFYSAHPEHMKFNVARSFIRKVLMVSHIDFHAENKLKIQQILAKNNFPSKIIHKLYGQVIHTQQQPNRSTSVVNRSSNRKSYPFLPDQTKAEVSITNTNQKFAAMTYIPGLSEEITKKLKYFVPDVKIAPKPPLKMVQFYSKLKQPIEKADLSGVVYDISCESKDVRYIGETIQKLGSRTGQHKNDCKPDNLAKLNKKRTALAYHVKKSGHQFDFDIHKIKILKHERNKTRLQIQEVNQIIIHEDSVCNYKSDSLVIGPAYGDLLKQYHKHSKKIANTVPVHRQRTHASHGFSPTSLSSFTST